MILQMGMVTKRMIQAFKKDMNVLDMLQLNDSEFFHAKELYRKMKTVGTLTFKKTESPTNFQTVGTLTFGKIENLVGL